MFGDQQNWWNQQGSYFGQNIASTGTGPIKDHTTDNRYGRYMLFWTGSPVTTGMTGIVSTSFYLFCIDFLSTLLHTVTVTGNA